jgi:hypothetical protein
LVSPRQLPDEGGEVLSVAAHFFVNASTRYGRFDLGAGANDARVIKQPGYVRLGIRCNLLWIEIVKGLTEGVTLPQNGDPGETGLKALQHEKFPERAAIVLGNPPFFIMVGAEKRVAFCPGTTVRLCHWVVTESFPRIM